MKYAIEMKVMNSLLCLLLFVLLFNSGKSQTEIDTMSFTSVLAQAKSDSARQWIILDYIEDHYRNEPDYCLSLTDTLLMLGKKNPQDNHISKALSFAGAIFKNKGEYSTALDFHFQSEQINLLKNDKKALATNYNDIGIIYKTLKEYDKALEYYLKSNSLTVEMGMKRGIVMTLNNIGTI